MLLALGARIAENPPAAAALCSADIISSQQLPMAPVESAVWLLLNQLLHSLCGCC